jgi:hypothetical protein
MGNGDFLRIAIVVGGLLLYFQGQNKPDNPKPDEPKPTPVEPAPPYTGPYQSLHQSTRSMTPEDRDALSGGFKAGFDMGMADSKGLINATNVAQDFVVGLLQFDYNGIYKPSQKYPAVVTEVSKIMEEVLGDEVKDMTPSERDKFIQSLNEISKAVK